MAEAGYGIPVRNVNPLPIPYPATEAKSTSFQRRPSIIRATSSKRNEFSPITRKSHRSPRRLVKISTAEGRWLGKWDTDYTLSLRDLQLEDLADDGNQRAQVFITLSIEKQAGLGLSVDGRILTSFTSKCSNCSSLYCREINTNFNVWVLPSSNKNSSSTQRPEIGGDDPSVIYVKPGYEADLDSLIQDTIRLTASVNETCSDSCEKAEPRLHRIGEQNTASIDRRWSSLLELRRKYG
ncbi:hypothetical protein RJ640_019432 [Escallonia rubra]|uniref:Large ribosomal RNA subunit accumulation protein YCED homolog 2, chloroplastic n=1 Tax=Escallonia rubra TaxID=112253 RepID=A0AA88QSB4_9ASTE|nr:hypothetical protein RJ640_019432 [Escallonia rubra]